MSKAHRISATDDSTLEAVIIGHDLAFAEKVYESFPQIVRLNVASPSPPSLP